MGEGDEDQDEDGDEDRVRGGEGTQQALLTYSWLICYRIYTAEHTT